MNRQELVETFLKYESACNIHDYESALRQANILYDDRFRLYSRLLEEMILLRSLAFVRNSAYCHRVNFVGFRIKGVQDTLGKLRDEREILLDKIFGSKSREE